jgi:phosphocarrier protein
MFIMAEKTLEIINRLGLHARATTKLVTLAGKFEADIRIEKDGREVSAKSIMGVLMLAAPKGSKVTLRAEGSDAEAALAQLEALINERFGEES